MSEMMAVQKMFNQPMMHERYIVEHEDYITVREWLGAGWQAVLWIYQDPRGYWIISDSKPYWHGGAFDACLWWADRDKEEAISLALMKKHDERLCHSIDCNCRKCSEEGV